MIVPTAIVMVEDTKLCRVSCSIFARSIIAIATPLRPELPNNKLLNGKPVVIEILPFSSLLFGNSGRRGVAIAIMDLAKMEQETRQSFVS
ncbi:MAG: hypothetical protein ACKPCM_20185, partial [Pseudanabaena sp.]